MNLCALYPGHDIGDWSYGRPRILSWGEGTSLAIGKFCSIAEGVVLNLGGEHRTDWVTTYPFTQLFEGACGYPGHPRSRGDIVIGNDVWIGMNAMVLSGVEIGDGAVVGAASVVTKDVSPYSIVAGNPARSIRTRFPKEIVDALLEIRWWDWPIEEIREAWPLLLSSDLEKFVARYGPRKDHA